jgi:hypothetical protein
MRIAWAPLCLLLLGCRHKPDTTPVSNVPAGPPPPIACPETERLGGAAPPLGYEMWCQIVAATGQVTRQGPAIEWNADGTKKALGQYDYNKKHGYWQTWYPDGSLASQGSYEHGVPIGVWVEFHPGGGKKSEGSMSGGLANGQWTWWHPNGQIQTQGMMVDGQRDGKWIEYDEQGAPRVEREYRSGRLITHREL